jgi:hypothetical protein
LEICEEACRVEEELRDEMEDSSWDDESVSRVGESVVAMEPLEVMVSCDLAGRNWRKQKKRGGQQGAGMEFVFPANVMVASLGPEALAGDWLNIRH